MRLPLVSLALAAGLSIVACGERERSPAPIATAEPVRPPVPTASAEPSAAPPPVQRPATERPAVSAAPEKRCDVDLPREMEFLECYARPRDLSYPDCRTFRVERLDGDDACQPARLSLGVSGFQSIIDELLVEVRWEAGPPRRAKLVLERVKESLLGNDEKPGTIMATLVFAKGGPREILLGPAMRRYTSQTRAKRTDP